jgi:hypothetical protein
MLSDTRRDIDHEVRGQRAIWRTSTTHPTWFSRGRSTLRTPRAKPEAGEIERAIEKIDSGTYGICEMCNEPIGADRLKFLPYVTLCIKCQELSEIRRRAESDELDDLAEGSEADSENN